MPESPTAGAPLVLREPTTWGVRLTLNRPAKLNAISTEQAALAWRDRRYEERLADRGR